MEREPKRDNSESGKVPFIIYRHPVPIRIFHWINMVSVIILLLSGFQIFNAHPRLYLGHTGYYGSEAAFEITGTKTGPPPQSWIQVGDYRLATTGLLGMPEMTNAGVRNLAFPSWLRLPMADDLGRGRGWHFLMVWVFVVNGVAYLIYGLASRRFRNEFLPSREQLGMRAIAHDLWMHLRLRHPRGEKALKYNLFQKLAYMAVVFFLLPLMLATGMTMSNTAVAGFPWLIDLFGGRQTARLLHFACAISILSFIVIHVFQVFVAGFRREMRSMITGFYHAPPEVD